MRLAVAITVFALPAASTPISALYYNLPNGNIGGLAYLDDAYTCQGLVTCSPAGDNQIADASLTGGLGDLTDGIRATQNWFVTPGPYVAWTANPLLEFFFTPGTSLSSVTLAFDDPDGTGGVALPASVTFGNGTDTLSLVVDEVPGSQPVALTFDISSLGAGGYLSVRLVRKSDWVFLSEASFDGTPGDVPEPGAGLLVGLALLAVTLRCGLTSARAPRAVPASGPRERR